MQSIDGGHGKIQGEHTTAEGSVRVAGITHRIENKNRDKAADAAPSSAQSKDGDAHGP